VFYRATVVHSDMNTHEQFLRLSVGLACTPDKPDDSFILPF